LPTSREAPVIPAMGLAAGPPPTGLPPPVPRSVTAGSVPSALITRRSPPRRGRTRTKQRAPLLGLNYGMARQAVDEVWEVREGIDVASLAGPFHRPRVRADRRVARFGPTTPTRAKAWPRIDNGTCYSCNRASFGSGGKFEARYRNESGKVGKRIGVSDSFTRAHVHPPEFVDNPDGRTGTLRSRLRNRKSVKCPTRSNRETRNGLEPAFWFCECPGFPGGPVDWPSRSAQSRLLSAWVKRGKHGRPSTRFDS
jgi:hypothetical protein